MRPKKLKIIGASVELKTRNGGFLFGVVRYEDPKGRYFKVGVGQDMVIVLAHAIRWLDDVSARAS